MRRDGDDASPGEPAAADSAPRRKGRPPKTQSADLTGAIVEIATRLFLANGFQATSMDAIAAEAGSSKRTLYARFPSKIDLFQEVVRQHIDSDVNRFSAGEASEEPLDILLLQLGKRLYAGAMNPRNITLFRLMAAETFRHPEAALIDQTIITSPLLRSLARTFQKRIDRGEIIDRPASFLAEQFLEAVCASDVRRAIYGRLQPQSPGESRERVTMAIEIFLRGIKV